jgi:hypothetical protein
MQVTECDVPSSSALGSDFIRNAYFHDSWRAPMTRPELGIVEVFFALFGHHPRWMKLLLLSATRRLGSPAWRRRPSPKS